MLMAIFKREEYNLNKKSKKLLSDIHILANNYNLNCTKPKINCTNNIPFYYIRFNNFLPLRLKKGF